MLRRPLPQHLLQRHPLRKYRSHTNPELRQESSHLAADQPHPDYHRSPLFSRLALDRIAFGDRAELMDPRQPRARNREAAVPSARRDQELLILELLA